MRLLGFVTKHRPLPKLVSTLNYWWKWREFQIHQHRKAEPLLSETSFRFSWSRKYHVYNLTTVMLLSFVIPFICRHYASYILTWWRT